MFFLSIAKLAIDGEDNYSWVKYLFIDDPISSLDDNYAIEVAVHLAQLLKNKQNPIKIISTHHGLFFNVIHNELGNRNSFFMNRVGKSNNLKLNDISDQPNFQHIALLHELLTASDSGEIYTYHFNMLRNVLEKSASFLGYKRFSDCIIKDEDDLDNVIFSRIVNLLSHGKYSLFDPIEMSEENKGYFRKILFNLIRNVGYNPALLTAERPQDPSS